ncbi:MAG: nucleotidyl transferase AbiEii/AbiGii toxin family protein [Staphylococcus equorum]|nr:nucleotidyl transferase AbiEii/AbiGii toxin family protein [Staphylococcus equorum]
MYLHIDNPDLLKDMILYTAEKSGINETIIEKDYYVTLVLKELVKLNSDVVFKGGTSLSKAYKVITRFSEDIDITFENHIGHAKRKKLKYNIMKNVSEYLQLPISNWKEIESDKNYNHYDFEYVSISTSNDYNLRPYIKLETALMSYAFPTEIKEITSVLYDALKDTDRELLVQYELMPFQMKVQSIDRTFIDKIFALCDYYLLPVVLVEKYWKK